MNLYIYQFTYIGIYMVRKRQCGNTHTQIKTKTKKNILWRDVVMCITVVMYIYLNIYALYVIYVCRFMYTFM